MTFSRCRTSSFVFVSILLACVVAVPSLCRDLSLQRQQGGSVQPVQDDDPLKRPVKDGQSKKAREKEGKAHRDWEKDVKLIITDEELAAFRKLGTDAERDQFIYRFWDLRDPTPDTEENEYKEEFYRRKAYANEHFGAGMPGEQTDRGRIYILHGPPDSIEPHPMGGPYLRPAEEGGGTTTTYPFEIWRYRHLDGIGDEITIEFVDSCGCGEYRKTLNYSDKDAGAHIPNVGSTDDESLFGANKGRRLVDPQGIGQSLFNPNSQTKFFQRVEQDALLDRPPALRLAGTDVHHIIRTSLLHFDARVDFLRGTADTALMPVTVQVPNSELTFVSKDGVQRGLLNIYGSMTTMTGKVVQTFEDTVRLDIPAGLINQAVNNVALYWKALPMRPGRYLLDIVVKDMNGDKLGIFRKGIQVPAYGEDKLTASSLILADVLQPVAIGEVGSGDFVLGPSKVRPRVEVAGKPVRYKHDQNLGVWMQVYHLAANDKNSGPAPTVEYLVVNATTNQPALDIKEAAEQVDSVADRLTVQKKLSLAKLSPGEYRLTVRVTDSILGQSIASEARFEVE